MPCQGRRNAVLAVDRGLSDPRLYSNLRGALRGEDQAERIAAHATLDCYEQQTATQACAEGWTRGGTAPPDDTIPTAACVLALVLLLRRQLRARARWTTRPEGW